MLETIRKTAAHLSLRIKASAKRREFVKPLGAYHLYIPARGQRGREGAHDFSKSALILVRLGRSRNEDRRQGKRGGTHVKRRQSGCPPDEVNQPLALPARRLHDLRNVSRSPLAEGADAEPRVQIAPLDYNTCLATASSLYALEIARKVAVQASFDIDAASR